MIAAIDSMMGVDNLELYLKVALQAGSPAMAMIITESAVMTAGYHKHIAPLQRLAPIARIVRAEKSDGSVVVILPNDHIILSNMLDDLAGTLADKAKIKKGTGLEIWSLGGFSTMALSNLEKMGWKVNTRVRSKLTPSRK